ncbi:MAG: hypothetical protein R3E68_05750 [Burkholderiaceae bacterium]
MTEPREDLRLLMNALVHELRTPLNAMAGWLEVVRLSADGGKPVPQKALDGIARAVTQQITQVNSLAELAGAPVRANHQVATLRQSLPRQLRRQLLLIDAAVRPALTGLPADADQGAASAGASALDDATRPLCDLLLALLQAMTPGGRIELVPTTDESAICTFQFAAPLDASVLAMVGAIDGSRSLDSLAQQPRKLLLCWKLGHLLRGAGLSLVAHADQLRLEPAAPGGERPDGP